MRIIAVLNPISGGNDKDSFIEYFNNTTFHYGIETAVFQTTGDNDLNNLISFLKNKSAGLLVAIGGDGTFSLAARASVPYQIPVGIVPFGSSNGMAKELGVSQQPQEAFDDLLKSRMIRKMDMIAINETLKCLHLSDIGVNARVVKAYEADENRGMLTYGKYMAQQLKEVEQIKYEIEVNGELIAGECVMIIIANGRRFGTGVAVTESGNPFDGEFEIAVVEEINLGTILKAGLSAIDELYIPQNVSKLISTKKALIRFESPQLLQSDGEVIGEFTELRIQILKEEFLFQTHRDNPYLEAL